MKKYLVEVSITRTFNTTVVVEGDFADKKDSAITETAGQVADNMDHGLWDCKDIEFEVNNVIDIPEELSNSHITLLECSYPLEMIKNYTEEDAEAELDAIGMES